MFISEPFAVVVTESPPNNEMLRETVRSIEYRLSNKPKGVVFPLYVHPDVIKEASIQNALRPYINDAYVVGATPY